MIESRVLNPDNNSDPSFVIHLRKDKEVHERP